MPYYRFNTHIASVQELFLHLYHQWNPRFNTHIASVQELEKIQRMTEENDGFNTHIASVQEHKNMTFICSINEFQYPYSERTRTGKRLDNAPHSSSFNTHIASVQEHEKSPHKKFSIRFNTHIASVQELWRGTLLTVVLSFNTHIASVQEPSWMRHSERDNLFQYPYSERTRTSYKFLFKII